MGNESQGLRILRVMPDTYGCEKTLKWLAGDVCHLPILWVPAFLR